MNKEQGRVSKQNSLLDMSAGNDIFGYKKKNSILRKGSPLRLSRNKNGHEEVRSFEQSTISEDSPSKLNPTSPIFKRKTMKNVVVIGGDDDYPRKYEDIKK